MRPCPGLLLLSLAAVGGLTANGARAEDAKPEAAALPEECALVVHGEGGRVSPDGKRLAFVRWERLGGGTYRFEGPHGPGMDMNRVPRVWIRDTGTGREWALPRWKPEGPDGTIRTDQQRLPLDWLPQGALLLDDGSIVDPTTGASVEPAVRPPPEADVASFAWTRDGKRVAYVSDWRLRDDEYPSTERAIFVRAAGEAPRAVPLASPESGPRLEWEAERVQLVRGRLRWSEDGKRLHFTLLFRRDGDWRTRWRVGFADEDGVAHVLSTSNNDHGLPAFVLDSERAAWDLAGTRRALLEAPGDGEGEVLVASADGKDVARVTDDGGVKWSPAMSPDGRRVAWFQRGPREYGESVPTTIRVLDLETGSSRAFPAARSDQDAYALRWSRDGRRLFYEHADVYVQQVPPAGDSPAGRAPAKPPRFEPTTPVARALASGREHRVEWAADRLREAWDPTHVPALRAALREWTSKDNMSHTGSYLLDLAYDRGAREVLPEVREALKPGSPALWPTIGIAAEWMGAEALPALDAIRTVGPAWYRAEAAAAMVRLGDEHGWDTLVAEMGGTDPPIYPLIWIAQPRSVDLLLPLLDDRTPLEYQGWGTRADEVEIALAILTGKTFAKDRAKWASWWTDEARRVLPKVPEPNLVVRALRREGWERHRAMFSRK